MGANVQCKKNEDDGLGLQYNSCTDPVSNRTAINLFQNPCEPDKPAVFIGMQTHPLHYGLPI